MSFKEDSVVSVLFSNINSNGSPLEIRKDLLVIYYFNQTKTKLTFCIIFADRVIFVTNSKKRNEASFFHSVLGNLGKIPCNFALIACWGNVKKLLCRKCIELEETVSTVP